MSLANYLERDVFERLYHTSTKASRAQRYEGELPLTNTDRNPFMMGDYKASMKIFDDNYFTPSRRKTGIPLPRSQKFKSPASVAASPSRFKPRKSPPPSSSPQIPSPPRRRQIPTPSRRPVKWSPKKNAARPPKPAVTLKRRVLPATPQRRNANRRNKSSNDCPASASKPPALWDEQKNQRLRCLSQTQAAQLFKLLQGKNQLSLSQIGKGLDKYYPSLPHKPLVLVAYDNYTGSDQVQARDFAFFMHFLVYFHNLWEEFVFFDEDDLRVSKGEFLPVAEKEGLSLDKYEELDPAGDGFVQYGDLCAACAYQVLESVVIKQNSGTTTASLPLAEELLNIMQPPTQEKALCLFRRLDEIEQGAIDFAIFEKGMKELYPSIERLPLALRAFSTKSTCKSVTAQEFQYALLFLIHFINLWDAFVFFDDDADLRISKGELIPVAEGLGLFDDVEATFQEMGANGGGFILFEDFCDLCAKLKLSRMLNAPPMAGPDDLSKSEQSLTDEVLLEIFDSIDVNGNGKLSLAELDKYIVEERPEWDHKPAILRAYRVADRDKDGFVLRSEFPFFYRFVTTYNKYWDNFASADESGDRRLSREEFATAAQQLGDIGDIDRAFASLDVNGSGYVLFDEFCAFCASHELGLSRKKDLKEIAKAPGTEAPVQILEAWQRIKLPLRSELLGIFDSIDVNSSGKLSLADLDEFVESQRPHLNRKTAIMRAYQAADREKDGFVLRSEFPFFYNFIAIYCELWECFASPEENGDIRMTKSQFILAASQLGDIGDIDRFCEEIDVNGEGYILLDEFCAFATTQKLVSLQLNDPEQVQSEPRTEPMAPADPRETELLSIFDEGDVDRKGKLSLAELDKFIEEHRPAWHRKSAIIRAHRVADEDDDGFVLRTEFPLFYQFVESYSEISDDLAALNKNGNHRIGKEGLAEAARHLDDAIDVESTFAELDDANSGSVMFDELCAFFAKRKLDLSLLDVNAKHNWTPRRRKRKKKRQEEDFLQIFDSIDVHGRRILSCEEVGRYILEQRPEWNRKSSITRAFKAADKDKDGFILRSEFGFFCRLIASYTKFWDPARRITKEEFAAVAWKLGVKDSDAAFAELDPEDRGYISFDKFTEYKEKCKREKTSLSRRKIVKSDSFESMDSAATFPMEQHDSQLHDSIADLIETISPDSSGMITVSAFEEYIEESRPAWSNKSATIHALRAIGVDEEDSLLPLDQTPFVLYYIFYYQYFWKKYTTMDGNGHRRVSKRQISRAARHLRLSDVDQTFSALDPQGNGHILFDTLCAYCAKQKLQETKSNSPTTTSFLGARIQPDGGRTLAPGVSLFHTY